MPPEPLPWDRKDFFKERKHERQEPYHHHNNHHHHPHPTGGGGGGGYGGGIRRFGGGPRWREQPHPHPHPYHYGGSPRWVSDFRYRPPRGYGKQGGRHLYPEESNHGFVPSRPSDRLFEDENCRPSVSGKYSRSSRESRGPFGQRDWKGQSWEATPSPNASGRPNDTGDQHRSVDDMQTCTSSHPHVDSVNAWDQSYLKDQHEKSYGVNDLGSSGQRLERENSLGSIDWKPLKWTRSGSLSSRGSGFSHSSSYKSMVADSNGMKAEVQPCDATCVQSPSGHAATPVAAPAIDYEASAAPSEERVSRKKPRLGWGEGLAKFEKKKVEGVDDITPKNGTIICSSGGEPLHLHSSHMADKSPRIIALSDCASPATPSSFGYSSSPGLEEKQFIKAPSVDNEATNLSPGIVSHGQIEGSTFNLENFDLAQIDHLDSAIDELLQSDDLTSVDSGFVKSTAISKLLVWKDDVLKKLVVTESEIDRLETELKSLASKPGSSCTCPAVSNSLPMECSSSPAEEQCVVPNISYRPAPLDLGSSGDNNAEKIPDMLVDDHAKAKDEDVDSPGSATSKFVEVASSGKDVSLSEPGNGNEYVSSMDCAKSKNLELSYFQNEVHEDKVGEISTPVSSCSLGHLDEISLTGDIELKLCESIFASNKESASRATEVFNKLLPADLCRFDISSVATICSLKSNSMVKENYLRRKRVQKFKEKCIALKYRALQHLWEEDVRSLSMRKFRVKSQKRLDLCSRFVQNSSQKRRSSFRSRLSSLDGNVSSSSNAVMMDSISKLLSDSEVKPCRDTLKMPAMILDKKEKMVSRFISSNCLVDDPCAVEKERSMINPWTSEEKEVFMDKLAVYGKDFTKIATFLVHKTTADCVEFYYKNHKSDCFKKTKKHPEYSKQGKSFSANNYLVAAGKRWRCEANAASLDILGAASAIAATVDDDTEIQLVPSSKYLLGRRSYKSSKGDYGLLERSSSLDADNERETVAADVLAGICGSLSSEAMSSCITSAVDRGERCHEWKYTRVGSSSRLPLTPEAMQNCDEETCSDESCGEMDPTDWTDEEKSIFIQAVSSYGKDFAMISRSVSTRSREQCKVFFSKARKCLGLDMICSGSGNVVRRDASGGSDTEYVGVAETGSMSGSEKSGVKLEVDLPCPEVKLNSESGSAGLANLNAELNHWEGINGTVDPAGVEAEPQLKDLTDDAQMEEKPEQEVDEIGDIQSAPSDEVEQGTVITTRGVGETSDSANTSDSQDRSGAVEKLAEHFDAELEGLSPFSWECSVNHRKDTDDANLKDVNGTGQSLKPNPQDDVSGGQQFSVLESDSALKPCVIPSQLNGFPTPMNSVPQSCAVKCGQTPNEAMSSAFQVVKITGEQGHQTSRLGEKLLSGRSLLGSVDPCQILRGYPVPPSTTREVSGNRSCSRSAPIESIPKLDTNFHNDRHLARDPFIQKCNGAKRYSSIGELPFKFREQSGDSNSDSQSGGLSDVEKPRRNGDVKLFGQILTKPSSQLISCSSTLQSGDNENQQSNIGKATGTKSASDQTLGGNLSQTKLDRNNFMGSENHSVKSSFGYWDGSRTQTGFRSLPDSAVLLAKYPAAFGNYVMPSSKIEQLAVHGVNNGERGLNGSAVFPAREIGSSNAAAAEYQAAYRNREMQTFALDMKQRHDAVLSEMQRRNGFNVVSGVQQQARGGMVGINVGRAGILVGGGQCTGVVSDPVAALRMHYSKAELNGGQNGSMIRDDDSWRGKGGSVGR